MDCYIVIGRSNLLFDISLNLNKGKTENNDVNQNLFILIYLSNFKQLLKKGGVVNDERLSGMGCLGNIDCRYFIPTGRLGCFQLGHQLVDSSICLNRFVLCNQEINAFFLFSF